MGKERNGFMLICIYIYFIFFLTRNTPPPPPCRYVCPGPLLEERDVFPLLKYLLNLHTAETCSPGATSFKPILLLSKTALSP